MSGDTESARAVDIPTAALEQIYRQARAEFPNECCGYLRGRGAHTQVVPCTNVMDELHASDPELFPRTAANGYQFASRELLAFARSFRQPPPATVIYHSHPRVGAYFSDEDTRAALSAGYDVDYLVVDAQEDEIRGAVLFRRDGERFVEIARFAGRPG